MRYIMNKKYLVKSNIAKLPELTGFMEFEKPEYTKENYLDSEYNKFINANEVYHIEANGNVSMYSNYEYNNKTKLIVNDGILIGIDDGEWIGELTFRDCDSNLIKDIKYRIIERDNIIFMFEHKGSIIVLAGLAHLGGDRGKLYIIKYKDSKWKIQNIIDINSEPQIYTLINDQEILIITYKGMLLFNGEIITKQINNSIWEYSNINSIFVTNENIFLGARPCIFCINKENYTVKIFRLKTSA